MAGKEADAALRFSVSLHEDSGVLLPIEDIDKLSRKINNRNKNEQEPLHEEGSLML
ncbi:hypothetical protein [Bacillus sp. PK3_68]|uniref:hypothetical protein n=1 Tax=Bacillaceae TaxID=186817 RepID=UPI001603FF11|nr:hypothetical protein [Bacillus sp. PK3_68]